MELFYEISIILVIATVIAGISQLLKQPLILGHIITGLLVGPQFLNFTHGSAGIESFSQLGITILLFIVGLSLSPGVIKEIGKVALVTGLGQIIFTSVIGYVLCLMFGYSPLASLYISVGLTFSSTIIVLKLINDKKDLEKLYAKISVGFLLVQDLAAIIILVLASSFGTNLDQGMLQAGKVFLAGILLTFNIFIISKNLLPRLADFFAKSQEYLFLFSIGWGFGLATLFKYIGMSIEVGALIAGIGLSITPYAQEISNKLKPLREFFLVMFFVLLGLHMNLNSISSYIIPALVFSAFILIGNPIIVIILMEALGYNKKTSFMAGLAVAQISEFSLIMVLLGVSLGHLDERVLSMMTVVGIITISLSSYMFIFSEKIFPYIEKHIGFVKPKKQIEEYDLFSSYDVVLFGGNRIGYDFIDKFKHLQKKFLIVDYDPDVVKAMVKKGLNCRYGDAEDGEFLEELNLAETKMVISTVPSYDDTEFLVKSIRKNSDKVIIIVMSHSIDEALKLYEVGATYVILPHFIGGQYAAQIAKGADFDIQNLAQHRTDHIQYLQHRKELGHTHPKHI